MCSPLLGLESGDMQPSDIPQISDPRYRTLSFTMKDPKVDMTLWSKVGVWQGGGVGLPDF